MITFNNLNAEMARNNMTVEDLVQRIGVTRKTYYNWVHSNKIPSTKLIEIAKLFGCSIDYLVGLTKKFK